jgi:hydroxysqualene dehydroxylase
LSRDCGIRITDKKTTFSVLPESNMDEVVIIGGGFAGLAAGVALAESGRRVRLFEQKPYLGGRARSFVDSATGSVVDNGQHLLMGCYHATRRFFASIGTLERVAYQPKLSIAFVEPGRGVSRLECPDWPSPWHLILGVAASDSFAGREKLEIARLGRRLSPTNGLEGTGQRGRGGAPKNGAKGGLTVEQWLIELGQSEDVRRNFWDLISIAAMNEDPRVASASLFERVLRLALFQSAGDSCLGIPRFGLSECYTEAARDFITARGGSVELGRSVKSLWLRDAAAGEVGSVCEGVKLADGETARASAVVSAVPWHAFLPLLPEDLIRAVPAFSGIRNLRPAPIISIYLWLDRPITDLEFAGLRGTTMQWIFNKSRILGQPRPNQGQPETGQGGAHHLVSLVLSGAHDHINRSKEDLVSVAREDLAGLFPASRAARLMHALVIKERLATFSPSVESEGWRPPTRTTVRRLYLAGDWTDTGLPATIEGAVESGYTAAEEILRDG